MVQDTFSLPAQTRTIHGKQVATLRQQGIIPAVVYGHGRDTISLQVNARDFAKVYAEAGRGSLINLSIDQGTVIPVVVQELSTNHVNDNMEHIDFHAVRMDEEITSQAVLVFTGEAPAVKTLGGTFVRNKDHVTIKCLPSKLVKEFTVDISALATFEHSLKVQDLVAPEGVKIMDQPGDILASVEAPRSDEELAALNQAVTEDVSKVEGVVKPTAEEAAAETAEADKTEKKPEKKSEK